MQDPWSNLSCGIHTGSQVLQEAYTVSDGREWTSATSASNQRGEQRPNSLVIPRTPSSISVAVSNMSRVVPNYGAYSPDSGIADTHSPVRYPPSDAFDNSVAPAQSYPSTHTHPHAPCCLCKSQTTVLPPASIDSVRIERGGRSILPVRYCLLLAMLPVLLLRLWRI